MACSAANYLNVGYLPTLNCGILHVTATMLFGKEHLLSYCR
jgi:hypothetical protein